MFWKMISSDSQFEGHKLQNWIPSRRCNINTAATLKDVMIQVVNSPDEFYAFSPLDVYGTISHGVPPAVHLKGELCWSVAIGGVWPRDRRPQRRKAAEGKTAALMRFQIYSPRSLVFCVAAVQTPHGRRFHYVLPYVWFSRFSCYVLQA